MKSAGGGGGECSLLQVRYEKWGGGGGGGACRTMIYICARARDSAWGMERGGRQLVPEGGISYEWGGRPPPPRAYAGSGAVCHSRRAFSVQGYAQGCRRPADLSGRPFRPDLLA